MKKILVVVDMQNDFISGALGSSEALAIVENAADKIRDFKGDIIVTYDTHTDNYMYTLEGKNLPIPHCIKGTSGWEIDDRIAKALAKKDFYAIEKPTFGSTKLIEYITDNYNPDEIEIELIGLCTDICVVSNALLLKANFTETKISVDAGCCAGVTVQSHTAALVTMKMCQINIKE